MKKNKVGAELERARATRKKYLEKENAKYSKMFS